MVARQRYRAYFVCCTARCGPYLALQVLAGIAIVAGATVVGWGLGAMAPDTATILHPTLWGIVLPAVWLIAASALAVNRWRQLGPFPNENPANSGLFSRMRSDFPSKWRAVSIPLVWFTAGTLAAYIVIYFSMESPQTLATRFPTYCRSMTLTNGVSPELPPLAFCAGLYLWVWYSLQGIALMGQTKPPLPPKENLAMYIESQWPNGKSEKQEWMRMFSEEDAGEPIAKLCGTFISPFQILVVFIFIVLCGMAILARPGIHLTNIEAPIRSLGPRPYATMICLILIAFLSLMLAKVIQLLWIWRELRGLLVHLDRLPLRRSMKALPKQSWGSVWKMSGSVFEMRYELLTHQLRALKHLENCWKDSEGSMQLVFNEFAKDRASFASWYAEVWDQKTWPGKLLDIIFSKSRGGFAQILGARLWDDRKAFDQTPLYVFQAKLAWLAALLMVRILLPAWQGESRELQVRDSPPKQSLKDNCDKNSHEMLEPQIKHAEAFVCYVYLAFIQNILGRIRTMVMGILWLFVAATLAMTSYPFDPRQLIGAVMLLALGCLGVVITFVYAQMHRDSILSLVTDTEPGELGGDFWLKIVGFGTGPVLALLTTIFPGISDFVFSWLGPSLTSFK